jgi:hypothetical protein
MTLKSPYITYRGVSYAQGDDLPNITSPNNLTNGENLTPTGQRSEDFMSGGLFIYGTTEGRRW